MATKLALVGFAPSSRDLTPWNDPDFEIWSLNEGYNFPWLKRWDRWFQLHPRWDFSREGNLNDRNHFLWLKNESGICGVCKGSHKVKKIKSEEIEDCPACEDGIYRPNRRTDFEIVMQEAFDDIPGSVKYPLEEIYKKYQAPLGKKYFTSSLAYMLALALHEGKYNEIHLFGFEMAGNTEYGKQAPGAEWWMGFLTAFGMKIVTPPNSSVMEGKLYAYESMTTGYTQLMEVRQKFLEVELERVTNELLKLEGGVTALMGYDPSQMSFELYQKEIEGKYHKKANHYTGLTYAVKEVANLNSMYHDYFSGAKPTETGSKE